MRKILSKIKAAINKYEMIKENDKIAVGVSGGKDSLVLLKILYEIKKYSPVNFEIIAITLDPCFDNKFEDYSKISEFCNNINIKYIIKRVKIWEIIFKIRNEKNPCSLCSRMRRGILHDICVKENCTKIALGHHLDDAVQTFFMNLFHGGRIECFSPVSYLSKRNLFMIRPMIFCGEKDILRICKKENLPVLKSNCPVDGHTERFKTKILIKNLENNYPNLSKKVINAMKKSNLNNW